MSEYIYCGGNIDFDYDAIIFEKHINGKLFKMQKIKNKIILSIDGKIMDNHEFRKEFTKTHKFREIDEDEINKANYTVYIEHKLYRCNPLIINHPAYRLCERDFGILYNCSVLSVNNVVEIKTNVKLTKNKNYIIICSSIRKAVGIRKRLLKRFPNGSNCLFYHYKKDLNLLNYTNLGLTPRSTMKFGKIKSHLRSATQLMSEYHKLSMFHVMMISLKNRKTYFEIDKFDSQDIEWVDHNLNAVNLKVCEIMPKYHSPLEESFWDESTKFIKFENYAVEDYKKCITWYCDGDKINTTNFVKYWVTKPFVLFNWLYKFNNIKDFMYLVMRIYSMADSKDLKLFLL